MTKKKRQGTVQKPTQEAMAHLAEIAEKRIGGSVNMRGVIFQVMYAVYYLLHKLDPDNPDGSVRLEGLEDIDHYQNSIGQTGVELVQVKTSVNKIDAAQFWNMGVLQNFLAVHLADDKIGFRVVHDNAFAKGVLGNLANGQLDKATINHWDTKIRSIDDCDGVDTKEFLSMIRFEKISREKMESSIRSLLVSKFNINADALAQYEKALFFHAIEWSKERSVVTQQVLQEMLNQVTDSFLKLPSNTASQLGWIEKIDFAKGTGSLEKEYFLGKAARPEHIAKGLPVERKRWTDKIMESLRDRDVTIVKSSSGQGKSTLAWMVSKQLFDNGTKIYRLNSCDTAERIVHLKDFLTARVAIGESPLVVIDGLNTLLNSWSLLAEQVANLPVKIIISAREEDWYRYAVDLYKLSYDIVDIRMDVDEARSIYEQLRKRADLELKYSQWQPAWEQVAASGLLIEYTYLLTQGQMLRERLEGQVKSLARIGANGAFCLEVLRIVSVADSLGIKLTTEKVVALVGRYTAWNGDPYEPLNLLENEYLIKFDNHRIEGLHQVRSAQLSVILHKFSPVDKTLAGLLQIIDPVYVEQFASGLSGIVEGDFKKFLEDFAPAVSALPYIQIVAFLNGLMYDEPRKFYLLNKKIFDEINERGGIEVFVSDTLPFMQLNTLEKLAESLGDESDKLKFMVGKKRELSRHDIEGSDLFYFIRLVAFSMKNADNVQDLTGLAELVQWFKKAGARHKLDNLISKERLTDAINLQTIDDVTDLFYCHREFSPAQHEEFVKENFDRIISFFKKGTDTPAVWVDGDTFAMKYLLKNEKGLQLNEKSFSRVQLAHRLLPNFKVYTTDLIFLSFPDERTYKYPAQEAHKGVSPENLIDDFEVHLNRIWVNTILQNYEAKSVYEWQDEQLSLRKQALNYAKSLVRLLEFTIEGNNGRFQKTLTDAIELANTLGFGLASRKRFPGYEQLTADNLNKQWFLQLEGWFSSFTNLMNQFASIILLEKEKLHIAMINLKACYYDLKKMQEAFNLIMGASHRYFDMTTHETDEFEWYGRLMMTAEYFVDFKNKNGHSPSSAKSAVADWWDEKVYNLTGEFVAVL